MSYHLSEAFMIGGLYQHISYVLALSSVVSTVKVSKIEILVRLLMT